jgi:predicted kinase
MNTSKEHFLKLYNQFKESALWKTMEETTEGSPWHRESSVAVHTNMVVNEYLRLTNRLWENNPRSYFLGALACMFHDVGKPIKEEVKQSDARGEYRSYAAHELASAREFEQYALLHRTYLELSLLDIFAVGWMIQSHLPYKTTKPKKVAGLIHTARYLGIEEAFYNLLMADQLGRNADNAQENQQKVVDWIQTARLIPNDDRVEKLLDNPKTPTLRLLIGPSSAGKSTLTKEFQREAQQTFNTEYSIFSWDQLRLDWYTNDEIQYKDVEDRYSIAFHESCMDSTFASKCQAEFMKLLKGGGSIIVDNTNLSAKRRRFFVEEAMKRGYGVVMDVCMIERSELVRRAEGRDDRAIPTSVIINMHNSMTYPSLDECHEIMVH